jgi:hypothetical protein
MGKLNLLEKLTQPDIAYTMHQVARFCQDPKATHAKAIIHIAKYLRDTSDQGIILHPMPDKAFDVFADANFVGNWHRMMGSDDPSTAKSCSGYVILYPGCPIAWASKLQMIITLLSCEAEKTLLSLSLYETRSHS